jgi:L,D-transpeptidase YcbB
MNKKKFLLCWSVAVSLCALLTACTRCDDRDSKAPIRSSPPGTEIEQARYFSPAELIVEQIRTRIEAAGVVIELRAGGEPVYESVVLPDFYERRLYRPAWSDEHGPTRQVNDLVSALRGADLEGLRSQDYHLAAIEILLAAVRADARRGGVTIPDRWAELDLLLTDAFLVYGSHLLAGRVNPETLKPEWVANRRGADLGAVLETALASGDVAGTLAALAPPQQGFERLREALAYHRAVAARGGWPMIPAGPILRKGDHGPSVAALRERLRLGGDIEKIEVGDADLFDDTVKPEDTELFDQALEQALERFQRRHGLTADGELNAATRTELNVSVERRVEQLELNLERWRWLPQDLGRRHIIVNIAAFELEVVEDEADALDMKVVVGLPYHHTPVFSATMRYLVLNPYWQVPRDIAVQEILPHLKRDPSYLARQEMKVFQDWGPEVQEVDPATVNWSAIDTSAFPFRFCQDSGPINALGRVKFMFLNKFNVYLHDTPSRRLFDETQRDFSHGCIRIQEPIELALYLLRQDPYWNYDTLMRALDEAVDRSVPLPEPIPVHLLYWTAWADEDGTIQFRRDIYDRDAPLLAALQAPSPAKE